MTGARSSWRSTPRGVLVIAASAPIALLAVVFDEGLWALGLLALGLAVLAVGLDGMLALRPRDLQLDWEAPRLLFIGADDPFRVRLAALRPRRARIVLSLDSDERLAPCPALDLRLGPPQAGLEADVILTPLRRGNARLGRLWLRWTGPLGLLRFTLSAPVETDIPVVPNIRAVRQAAIQFTAWDAYFGIKAQRQQGDGSEFEALRDYVPGLDHRSIDWKHSARHRALVCKEFHTERNHQIVLAFDTGHLMSEPMAGAPRLDHAINAGLMLGYMSLRQGDRIGLHAFDAKPRLTVDPQGGMAAFSRLQRLSAELDYSTEETNFTLGLAELLGRLKRRSLVILQTDFVDSVTASLMVDNLRHLARRHLVLFVTLRDPALPAALDQQPAAFDDVARSVIAADFLRERSIVFQRLRRLGIHCLEASREQVGVELVNRYLAIKRQELI